MRFIEYNKQEPMKLKSFLCIGLGVLAANTMFAQANILNAKIPEEIGIKN